MGNYSAASGGHDVPQLDRASKSNQLSRNNTGVTEGGNPSGSLMGDMPWRSKGFLGDPENNASWGSANIDRKKMRETVKAKSKRK